MSGIRIGRLFGIDIAVHWSWFGILAFFAFSLATGFFPATYDWRPIAYWLVALAATLLLFVSVVAHELAHSLVARLQGIPVRGITLFILGGVASIEREASSPRREAFLAGIGPLVSLAIGLAAIGLVQVVPGPEYLVAVLFFLGVANISLAIFNMLPGFPMDGGRVLRALLWWRSRDFVKATRYAAGVSRVVAFGFIALGLVQLLAGGGLGGLWLGFIGWMLIQASRACVLQAELEKGLEGVAAGRLAKPPATWLPPFVTLDAASAAFAPSDSCLPVEAERADQIFDGALCRSDLERTPRTRWDSDRARDAMTGADDIPQVGPDTPMADVLRLMLERRAARVAVVEDGRLLGFVDREGTWRFVQRRSLARRPSGRHSAGSATAA
jgi:Zn-dependent protease